MKKHLILWLLIFTGMSVINSFAQPVSLNKLALEGQVLLDRNIPDSLKIVAAADFIRDFELYLKRYGPDSVNTTSLPFVSRLTSPDKLTEVFTWNLKRAEDSFIHYGLVLNKNKKTGETKLFRLEDKGETIKNPETKNLGKSSWMGCLYYSITDISKGKKPMYLLLGYGGNTPQVRRKVAEIISFNNVGDIQLGAPIFQKENKTFNRVVLEYNAKATVSLKYFPESSLLIFDFLVPVSDIYLGNPAFYGPDGSYNGFLKKGGKFIFVQDVDARNPTENKGNRTKQIERKLPQGN